MNWDVVEGNWKQFTGRVKEKWADITDDDLKKIEGKKDRFVGVLQERYGMARDEADKALDEWMSNLEEPARTY